MSHQPSISVILPVYNSGKYLLEAIQSLQHQTYPYFECLVCDASTDESSQFLSTLTQQDPRFIWLPQKGFSLVDSLQDGIARATAPLIARMDADDIAHPLRFEKQINVLKKQHDLLLLGSAIQYISYRGNKGRIVTFPEYPSEKDLLWGCPFSHPSVMFRRDSVQAIGGYRQFFKRAEDYDLWLRLLGHGCLRNLQIPLLFYRIHETNSIIIHAQENRNFAIIAQASYLLTKKGKQTILSPTSTKEEILTHFSEDEQAFIFLRMLACSAHLTGDEYEDAEAHYWLSRIKKQHLISKEIKQALALYYTRCARRYFRTATVRMVRNIMKAIYYDFHIPVSLVFKVVAGVIQKYLRVLTK